MPEELWIRDINVQTSATTSRMKIPDELYFWMLVILCISAILLFQDFFLTSSNIESQPDQVGPFMIGRHLGKGKSSVVRIGIHKTTGSEVAIKIIKKGHWMKNFSKSDHFNREIAVLKLMNHPNIVKLYNVMRKNNKIYLIFEYIKHGELFDYVLKKGCLKQEELARLFGQIVMALEYCKSHGICHRDVKLENILLDEKNNIKLIDFGYARVDDKFDTLYDTPCGSPHYASPEIIAGKVHYDGGQSDIWSLGVVLYAMSTGNLPFADKNVGKLMKIVMAGVYHIPSSVSSLVSDLISKMLVVDPKNVFI